MNKTISIILVIAIILLGCAAIVTHHFDVWPWVVSTGPVVTEPVASEPATTESVDTYLTPAPENVIAPETSIADIPAAEASIN